MTFEQAAEFWESASENTRADIAMLAINGVPVIRAVEIVADSNFSWESLAEQSLTGVKLCH